jgi:serine/threonine-protein kinase
MEFLHGAPLAALLERGRLSPAEANEIMIPVARGMAAAHAAGAVHRDLKPDNIFLCRGPDGRAREPKVLDFGLSKLNLGRESFSLTASGSMIGTPYYMAPEQISAAKEADARTDVYALGVILYEMLAGERPFEGETLPQLILNIMHGKPRPLNIVAPAVPAPLAAVISQAMSVPNKNRFASMEELARALEPFGHTRFDVQGPSWSSGSVGRTYEIDQNTLPLKISSQVGNPFADSEEHNTNVTGASGGRQGDDGVDDASTDRLIVITSWVFAPAG